MEEKAIYSLLEERFGEGIVGDFQEEGTGPAAVYVKSDEIQEVLRFLKEDGRTAFDSLMCLSGVDFEEEIQVVYHLHSMTHRHTIALKAKLNRERPLIPTVEGIYPVANYHEREAYDLLGIIFSGHSDLRRILLPEDWPGHPLRKDYTYPDQYHGIKV